MGRASGWADPTSQRIPGLEGSLSALPSSSGYILRGGGIQNIFTSLGVHREDQSRASLGGVHRCKTPLSQLAQDCPGFSTQSPTSLGNPLVPGKARRLATLL